MMKLSFVLLLTFSLTSFAECEMSPLQEQMMNQYQSTITVRNERGEIGHAKVKNFKVADYFIEIETERMLISNFELDIKWMNGKKQSIKSLVVASIDPETCFIKTISEDNKFSSRRL